MPRVPHHDGRRAVVTVLSAVLLLFGALAGMQPSTPDPVGHTDLHHTSILDLDLGTPAVAKSQWTSHHQRPDVHTPGVLTSRRQAADAGFPVATPPASPAPRCAACQVPLRGRAPPA